jgi:hypothetical protein
MEREIRPTCGLLLRLEGATEAFHALLKVVFLFFHVLYGLVALC